jgi:hypothetical protein
MTVHETLAQILEEIAGDEDRDVEEYTSRYEGGPVLRLWYALEKLQDTISFERAGLPEPAARSEYGHGYSAAIGRIQTDLEDSLRAGS